MLDLPTWIFNATVNTCILTLSKKPAPSGHNITTGDLRGIKVGDWQTLADNLNAIATHGTDIQTVNYARYTYPQKLISTFENLSFFIGAPNLYLLFTDSRLTRLGDIAEIKAGLQTGDNEYYIRKRMGARGNYPILDESKLLTKTEITNLNKSEKLDGVDPKKHGGSSFVPYDKGGESDTLEGWLPNYYVQTQYFINWSKQAVSQLRSRTIADVKQRKNEVEKIKPGDETKIAAYIRNPSYYFRDGLTFSRTGNYAPTFRLACGSGFDSKSDGLFLIDENQDALSLLGVLNSTLIRYLTKVFLSHTVQAEGDALLETPIISIDNKTSKIKELVKKIIEKQKTNPRYPYHLHEQKEIDKHIYQLYGLNDKDIIEIKLWYCRRYPRLAKAQGVWEEIEHKYGAD